MGIRVRFCGSILGAGSVNYEVLGHSAPAHLLRLNAWQHSCALVQAGTRFATTHLVAQELVVGHIVFLSETCVGSEFGSVRLPVLSLAIVRVGQAALHWEVFQATGIALVTLPGVDEVLAQVGGRIDFLLPVHAQQLMVLFVGQLVLSPTVVKHVWILQGQEVLDLCLCLIQKVIVLILRDVLGL